LEIFETIFWSEVIVLLNERAAPKTPGKTREKDTLTTTSIFTAETTLVEIRLTSL
jgi:hypothetical protein